MSARRSAKRDDDLIDRFMRQIARRSNLRVSPYMLNLAEPMPGLDAGHDDSPWASPLWKPLAVDDETIPFHAAYEAFPAKFPPLYERFAKRWRWLERHVPDLGTLMGNYSAAPLSTVLKQIASFGFFSDRLLARGLLQFANGPEDSFDPIAFDTRRPDSDGDFLVVRVNHEAILMDDDNDRPWPTTPVANSFRAFLNAAIERLEST